MEINDILTDEKKLDDGVWFDYRGGKVKIASWASKKYKRMKEALDKPYERQRRLGIKNDELDRVETENTCKAMARTILLDWQDFTSGGNPLIYSRSGMTWPSWLRTRRPIGLSSRNKRKKTPRRPRLPPEGRARKDTVHPRSVHGLGEDTQDL